jgi:hypothetical protein
MRKVVAISRVLFGLACAPNPAARAQDSSFPITGDDGFKI